jgi:hypothetical protein
VVWGHAPHKNFENLDAKSCNLRVFWTENVFPNKKVLRVFFFPSNMKIMKFDMIANEIATKEHRTMISQFSRTVMSCNDEMSLFDKSLFSVLSGPSK